MKLAKIVKQCRIDKPQHFKLADHRRVVCGISFGFPDGDNKINSYRTSRAGLAETATFLE